MILYIMLLCSSVGYEKGETMFSFLRRNSRTPSVALVSALAANAGWLLMVALEEIDRPELGDSIERGSLLTHDGVEYPMQIKVKRTGSKVEPELTIYGVANTIVEQVMAGIRSAFRFELNGE